MTIPLPHTAVGPLAFALGIALETAPRVLLRRRPGDLRRVAIALAVGLPGLVPVPGEHLPSRGDAAAYSLSLHLYLVVMASGLGLAWQFRDRVVPRVGARLLVAWSLLALATLWNRDGRAEPALLFVLPAAALALVNAFTGVLRRVATQWLLFAAWVTTLAVLTAVAWRVASWTRWEDFVGTLNTRTVAGNLLNGAALFSLVANAFFALAIAPLGAAGRRSAAHVRRHLDRLTRAETGAGASRVRDVAVLVVLPLVLVGNALRPVVDPSRLIAAVIALLPLAANARDLPDHESGGSPPLS